MNEFISALRPQQPHVAVDVELPTEITYTPRWRSNTAHKEFQFPLGMEWSTQCITIVINNLSKTLAHNCRKNFCVLSIWSKVKVSGHTFLRTDWKRKNT